jgi:Fe-S cluster assembly scaffold protein SufB
MKIANSNVIARHGNALGTLKKDEKYYLSSRGIDSYKELIKQSLLENAKPTELFSGD